MSIYDKSSLVLIPSGTKTGKVYSQKPVSGDGDFTFTRSSAATRVNADGFIEKETQNFLLQSNTFNTTWSLALTTLTSGQTGYDGSSDAWLLTSSDATQGRLTQSISGSGVYTMSIYAKAGSTNWMRFYMVGSPIAQAWFDLQNGQIGDQTSTNIDAKIESVGGGWYRCSMTSNLSLIDMRIYPSSGNGAAGGIGSIYIQDAQVERGLVARDYIETTTTAVEGGITDNVPRLDYTDSSCPALLLEPQRTNIVTHSEYFGAYSAGNQTRTANATTSPEGLENAYKLTATSDFSGLGVTHNLSASTTYTASFYVKNISAGNAPTSNNFPLRIAVYDYTNATTILSETYLDDISTSEWRRMTFSFTTTTAASVLIQFVRDLNNAEEIYIYGAQIEAGSYATSYIPTYGSSVTRTADTNYIQNGMTSLNSVDSMTIYFEVDVEDAIDFGQRYSVLTDLTSSSNWIFLSYEDDNNIRGYIRGNSNTSWDFSWSSGVPSSGTIKAALVIPADGNAKIYGNGQLRTSYSGAVLVNGFDTIALGGTNGAAANKQRLRQFMIFPTALTDQEAIDLTTI